MSLYVATSKICQEATCSESLQGLASYKRRDVNRFARECLQGPKATHPFTGACLM